MARFRTFQQVNFIQNATPDTLQFEYYFFEGFFLVVLYKHGTAEKQGNKQKIKKTNINQVIPTVFCLAPTKCAIIVHNLQMA